MMLNRQHIAKPLTIASLYYYVCIALALAASFSSPFSSSVFSEYVYNYEANIVSGPSGFKFKAKAHLELLFDGSGSGKANSLSDDGQLFRLRLTQPVFYPAKNNDNNNEKPLVIDGKHTNLYNPNHDLYAHIVTLSNGTAYIKQLFTHQADVATYKNIKKSILLNLLPTNHHLNPLVLKSQNYYTEERENAQMLNNRQATCLDDNNHAQPELFSPDSISQTEIIAKARKIQRNQVNSNEITTTESGSQKPFSGITIFESVEGHQNVTFRSRIFSQAESNLTTTFRLELIDGLESKAHEDYDNLDSISSAIDLFNAKRNYQVDSIELEREKRICSTHHCGKSLVQLYQDYKDFLSDENLASVEAAVGVLRILDRLRDSKGTGVSEILDVLKKMKGNYGVQSSFLDILAAARTKDSITAALKYLRLAKNNDLDTAERFLSVLSVVAKTASKMHLKRPLQSPYYFTPTPALKRSAPAKEQLAKMASLEFIAKEFLNILKQTPASKWRSHKLRWSTLLTLATLVNANNQEHKYDNLNDELNEEVSKLLLDELPACHKTETDCRIVVLQAIGNVGILGEAQFQTIKDHVLNSGRRESISAMKVLRDLLQNQAKNQHHTSGFYSSLKELLLRVVYDNSHETTARVLAAEMLVRFLPNSHASLELLNHLPSFGNHELATMIYSRMQSLRPDSLAKHHENWYWKSCIINGTSTSFVRTMAKTDSLNASYGVNVENKGKLPKESSFDVFLDTKERTQDLFSLGIFTRGLTNIMGGSDEGGEAEENEAPMAGMTLRLLGGYLRPYVFFTGKGELMSHVWSGTASEPTTAFNGDLLLIDHEEGYPLISGFVAEQQMRGVLSIDVTGKVKISFWHMNSNSVVRTKASIIVQASQSVFTSYDNFWHSHLFSFGGQAMIDFVADLAFSTSAHQVCLQVTQPAFIIR